MKRLVYSPQINAWVKTDTGIFDLSPYITGYSVNRKVNSVSSAELTFRNPKVTNSDGSSRYLFTEFETKESNGSMSYRPMFHPMDPIIITLTRLKGHPVQVFTGYCDSSPYVQLFPGTARLTASCTLKRLMYTYWDPGLAFVTTYLSKLGWMPTAEGLTVNAGVEGNGEATLNDSSISYLLYRILMDIGGWDHNDIFIQELPDKQISDAVTALYKDLTGDAKASFKTFSDFLDKIIGYGNLGGGGGSTAPSATDPSGTTGGSPSGQAAAVGYPLGAKGTFGGGPGEGTHAWGGTFNNWQSCNAVDILVPNGTSVFAVDDGTISRVGGSYSGGSARTDGFTCHLKTKDNEWFYQHNTRLIVTDGQKVKKGDPMGLSGSGNGVPHLHIACTTGNPVKLIGNIPGAPS
jgi:murein DD-endopeptidase MepM/ murein hydrolase activator NlpD